MKHTLLYGNGLNLLDNNAISWDQLLAKISEIDDPDMKLLPNILQYEKIFLDKVLNYESSSENELLIKNEIARLLSKQDGSEYYDDIIKLGFNNYLTTNYDNAFLKAYRGAVKRESTEKIYSVRRKTLCAGSSKYQKCTLWNIHGEIEVPKSIVLGLDHYCGYISKIDRYVKGDYDYQVDGETKKVSSIAQKLKGRANFDKISWIELFFNTNMHILGFSLDFNEIDIWWVLNKRARLKLLKGVEIKNKIYVHSANIEKEKKDLLESMGVEVFNQSVKDDYSQVHKKTIAKIKSLLRERQ